MAAGSLDFHIRIDSGSSVKLNSDTDQDLMAISVSAPLGLGQTAAGGTVNA